jgi:hypothetical protein
MHRLNYCSVLQTAKMWRGAVVLLLVLAGESHSLLLILQLQ